MKKICKKIILIKSLDEPKYNHLDFYIFNHTDSKLKDVENPLLIFSKKGLYRYILPGKFPLDLKKYFPQHTYIQYGNISKDIIPKLFSNKNIIIFKYKDSIFFNNSKIFRHEKSIENTEFLYLIQPIFSTLLICLLFFFN
jgi:hypothetical protein